MRKYIFVTIILLLSYCSVMYGQISTREEPISFGRNIPALRTSEKTHKQMPSLDMSEIEKEDKENDANGLPPRFGFRHKVSYSLDNSGEWTELSNGDRIWRLSIYCPEALSINLLYDKFWIPAGAKFFIYNNERTHSIGAFTSANNKGDRDNTRGFATGLVYGNQITLEYYLPNEVQEIGVISIAYVVHGYRYVVLPQSMRSREYGDSGDCQVNVNCSEGQDWQNEKNAVTLILTDDGRWCTGSLINTTANDFTPYLLTANHCITVNPMYDAINYPDLNDWLFYWRYESPECRATSDPSSISTLGATVVASNNILVTDFALLLLDDNPIDVPGIEPYYLGWDRSGNPGTGGVGIHHPWGDIKKISTYNATPVPLTCPNGAMHEDNYWNINFIQTANGHSVTEPGSSGSSLINSDRRIIGQLYGVCTAAIGAPIRCEDPAAQATIYGKFSVSWTGDGAIESERRLSDWLDPNHTGVTVLDGRCSYPVNFTNETVITNTTVTSPCDIYVENVIVEQDAKLTLDAPGSVKIQSDFKVELGSSLQIK